MGAYEKRCDGKGINRIARRERALRLQGARRGVDGPGFPSARENARTRLMDGKSRRLARDRGL